MITQLKSELLLVTRRCYEGGLQTGNGGNLSARIPGRDAMVVKASEVSFSGCTEADLVVSDFDGKLLEGGKKPSRESLLHGAIYRALPECMSVVHCHSPWATGWASTMDDLPHASYHSAIKMGDQVRVFDTGSYVVPADFFPDIVNWLQSRKLAKAFLLKGHGQVALGTSPTDAFYTAELVEETAQIAFVASMLHLRK